MAGADDHLQRMYERDLARWRQRVRLAKERNERNSDEQSEEAYFKALSSEPRHSDYFPLKPLTLWDRFVFFFHDAFKVIGFILSLAIFSVILLVVISLIN